MRTVVGLFDRIDEANSALRALVNEGFARDDISLISRDAQGEYSRYFENQDMAAETETSGASTGAGVGAVIGGLGGLLLGMGALAIPGIGPVLAAGPLMSALAGAGLGAVAGGLLGALTDLGIPEEHAELYAEGIRRGGSLLVVRAEDSHVEHARDILNRFNPIDIEERGATWRGANWSGFNESSQPLTAEEMEFNRTNRFDNRTTGSMTGAGMSTGRIVDQSDVAYGNRVDDMGRDVARGVDNTFDNVRDAGRDVGRKVDITFDRAGDTMRDMGHDVARGADHAVDNVRDAGRDFGRGVERTLDSLTPDFRNHYATRYSSFGRDYNYYSPAYEYGYTLANDSRYSGYDWDRLEVDARRDWEMQHRDTMWDDVKDAVQYAWRSITR